jgi:Spy/CpxP family protein refolding chaperone
MKKVILIILSALVTETTLLAQQNTTDDPFAKAFFPPELVMQNQQAINLTEMQQKSLIKEIQNAQTEFMSLQWDLQKETEKLKSLVEKDHPVEAAVTEELGQLLAIENKIKKRQISLMVRIKDLLTSEQQVKLRQLWSK